MSDVSESSAPQAVLELADACVRFVHRAIGIELDFTPDTLPILDHYLREAADVDKAEVLSLVAPAAGAYFGEVVRRSLGTGRWHIEDDQAGWRLEFERFFLSFNPVGAALEALWGGKAEGFGAHLSLLPEDRAAVSESLERVGEVRSDDFYRLAVRFEVVEQVAALLAEKALQQDGGSRTFGPEAYAALREGEEPPTLH